MAVNNLLEMKNVTKGFPGVKAIDKVNFSIRLGEVHALMGENGAGKSTLMKCLFGIYRMDEGEILLNGVKVNLSNPAQALNAGIAMVQQELEQVPHQSVMNNIWLGRYPTKGIFVKDKKIYSDTLDIIKDLNLAIDPKAKVSSLSVSTRQMVDIVKAVTYNAKVIVMDEPTSSLTKVETESLFRIIKRLKENGCGIIYISHKIDEVLEISDRVTVLRDGKWVATEETKDLNADTIVKLMVNRELDNRFPEKATNWGDVNLKVENLSTFYPPLLSDISFEVHKGEILGIGGLVGSGRTELLETIFGLRRKAGGNIYINGKELTLKPGKTAIDRGIVLLTEERRETGIFPLLDIRWNTVSSSIKRNTHKIGLVSAKKVRENTQWAIEAMNVKTVSMRTLISNLSGGNQQKVLLGRCLLREPDIMLFDEPTRGIDVGAKYEIYQLMLDLAAKGKTILFVSSEMPELIGVSDRILVMSNGKSAGIVDAKTATQEQILQMATKYL